jgi:RimJ/RimL family protein N-acetyltransferase
MSAPGKVRLRETVAEDVGVFFEHQLDPGDHRAAAFTAAAPDDRPAFEARWRRVLEDPGATARTVLLEDETVGHVVRFVRDGDHEVTYWIAPAARGRGVATAALAALLDALPERPVYARVAADHGASIRVLERCGFARVRREMAFARARGVAIEEYVFVRRS